MIDIDTSLTEIKIKEENPLILKKEDSYQTEPDEIVVLGDKGMESLNDEAESGNKSPEKEKSDYWKERADELENRLEKMRNSPSKSDWKPNFER